MFNANKTSNWAKITTKHVSITGANLSSSAARAVEETSTTHAVGDVLNAKLDAERASMLQPLIDYVILH